RPSTATDRRGGREPREGAWFSNSSTWPLNIAKPQAAYRVLRTITASNPRYTATSGMPTAVPQRQRVVSRSVSPTRGYDHGLSGPVGRRSERLTSQFTE